MNNNKQKAKVAENFYLAQDGTPVITVDFAIAELLKDKIAKACEEQLGKKLGYGAKDFRDLRFTVSESSGLLSINCIYPGIAPSDPQAGGKTKTEVLALVYKIATEIIGFID